MMHFQTRGNTGSMMRHRYLTALAVLTLFAFIALIPRPLHAAEGTPAGTAAAETSAASGSGSAGRPLPKTLRVLTKPIAPFVIPNGAGGVTGFSLDLWEAIAKRMNVKSEITVLPTLKALLDGVKDGAGDVGIAAITITADREAWLDFSHPYFRSGLQILVRQENTGVLSQALGVLKGMFSSPSFQLALMGLGILVILVAHLIWLVERRRNPDFTRSYPLGVWDAIYWTLVTISTVGYGDKTPKTHIGRLIALVLIVFGYVAFAWFTATITSAVTVSELEGVIRGPEDLPGHRVATVEHSTAENYLRHLPGTTIVTVSRIEDAYALLEAGKVDAVVYDFPALSYYVAHGGEGKVRTAGPIFSHEPYGIAMQEGSPLRESVNQALLHVLESGEYTRIYKKWFGTMPE